METALPNTHSTVQAVGKSYGIRAGAYMLDVIVLIVISLVVGSMTGFFVGVFYYVITGQVPALTEQNSQSMEILIGFPNMMLYFTLFEWLYGATPGKLILGLRVVNEFGSPCDLFSALIRNFIRLTIDSLFFSIPAIVVMKAPLYQRPGDKIANTIVVSSKNAIIKRSRSGWLFIVAALIYLLIISIVHTVWLLATIS